MLLQMWSNAFRSTEEEGDIVLKFQHPILSWVKQEEEERIFNALNFAAVCHHESRDESSLCQLHRLQRK